MKQFNVGDRVRVEIPDPDDVDHQYHQEIGEVIAISEDELSSVTGDPAHDYIYRVEFKNDDLGTMDFRYDDLTAV